MNFFALIAIFTLLAIVVLIAFFFILKESGKKVESIEYKLKEHTRNLSPEHVRAFYNEYTDKFMKVYGDIIQAYRTRNVNDYLDYTIKSVGIEDGMTILDAGCGIGGPAIYFALQKNIRVEGCTISDVQAQMAQEKITENGLKERVNIIRADYHEMDKLYPPEHFDRIVFLESFGHSPDKRRLIEAAWKVLKPGGYLYIKDLFEREAGGDEDMRRIKEICMEINQGYHYAIADLHEVLSFIRKKGYILNFIKTPEVDISLFEHLTISNDFQNLFNVSKIDSWQNYVFPIDFFEIKCQKPPFMIETDKHLYHMNRPEIKGE